MLTLKELAKKHLVNPTSLRIWLKDEGIEPTDYKRVGTMLMKIYDRKAVAAVAAFLGNRPRRGPGRPPKETAESGSRK